MMTKAPEFSWIPLLTSLVVALGGLTLGYFVYRDVRSPVEDKLQIGFLKNKYYFDELYQAVFIKPAYCFAENIVYKLFDQRLIDGVLHLFGPGTQGIGDGVRNYFDLPVINRLIGDGSADVTYWFGGRLRVIQTGRIQQYLMLALIVFLAVGAALYFFVLA